MIGSKGGIDARPRTGLRRTSAKMAKNAVDTCTDSTVRSLEGTVTERTSPPSTIPGSGSHANRTGESTKYEGRSNTRRQ